MSDQPSINIFDQIDSICRQYRRELKSGNGPQLEHFIGRVEEKAQANLLRNLLHTEIEFRRRVGESPNAADYVERFPDFHQIIRQAFFQSTMNSMVGEAEEETGNQPTEQFKPTADRLGEYRLIRELGRGGMGVVYEAEHEQRGNRVAIKTLPTGRQDDANRLHKFRKEFRSLAEISHPNLVGMQTLEVDGSQCFFTMDLVDGVDFLTYVRPHGELDEPRLRATLPQIVAGIMALHGRHVAHRDLKPSNVLVTDDGRVVILDFGLAVELESRTDETISFYSEGFSGTPDYAAPEQASGRRTGAGDWYSLGVMLFEGLTNELPFSGNAFEVLERKRDNDAPMLSSRAGIPDDLANLTDSLLARDPERRPDALEIAKVVSQGALLVEPPSDSARVFVGRQKQLTDLEQALRDLTRRREPIGVFISGRSGEGKTALAEHFLEPLRQRKGFVVLSGRCYGQESVPLKALDCLIDPFSDFLQSQKEDAPGWMPDDIHMLAHLFPVIGRIKVVKNAIRREVGNIDMKQVRQRGLFALREMLGRISRRVPVVLFVDDLHFGDSDSADAFFSLLNPPDSPAVLLLGTFRSDEAENSSFLTKWHAEEPAIAQQEVRISPLTKTESLELVVARVGKDTEIVRQRAAEMHESTEGNALLLDQLIECFDPDTDSFYPVPLDEVIDRKLNRLPPDATKLLEIVAVAGNEISLEEASLAAGFAAPAVAILAHMRKERLVRLKQDQYVVDTYHDKIREAVLDQLSKEKLKRLHNDLGQAIELGECVTDERVFEGLVTTSRVYDLAVHFDAGEARAKALRYGLVAAEKARLHSDLGLAIDMYTIAQRNLGSANGIARCRLSIGYSRTLMEAGEFDQAAESLRLFDETASNDLERAQRRVLEADIKYRSVSLQQALDSYADMLRKLGVRVPRTRLGLMLGTFGEASKYGLRAVVPGLKRFKKTPTAIDDLATRTLCVSLNYGYHFRDSFVPTWAGMAALNRTDAASNPSLSSLVYTMVGYRLLSWGLAAGDRFRLQAINLADQCDDLLAKASAIRDCAVGLATYGRLEDALRELERATELYETQVPDFYRLLYCRIWMGMVLWRLGRLDDANQMASEVFENAVRLGLDRPAHMALEIKTRCCDGQLPFHVFDSCFAKTEDDYGSKIQYLTGKVLWHLAQGKTEDAVAASQCGVGTLARGWNVTLHTLPILSVHARALREKAEALLSRQSRDGGRWAKLAMRASQRAIRVGYFIRCDYPAALREHSLTLMFHKRYRKALGFARRSCAAAEQQGARYELAQSQLAVAELSQKLGLPNNEALLAAAKEGMVQFERMIQKNVARWSTLPCQPGHATTGTDADRRV